MGRISQDTIDRVRASVDIADYINSYVPLQRRGANWVACCPFHKEKTPSFHVTPSKSMFYCYGCHVGGDVIRFIELFENLSYPEAIRALAERSGIPVVEEGGPARPKNPDEPSRREIVEANKNAMVKYRRALKAPDAADARAYLASRSFSPEICERWGIGYAPDEWSFLTGKFSPSSREFKILDLAGLVSSSEKGSAYDRFRDRIMFPIRNESGDVVAFSGRILHPGDHSGGKYVNSPETPVFLKKKVLFALDRARKSIIESGRAILVEGQIDCIRCHEAGFSSAVASQGTAFGEDHARILARIAKEVVVVLDGDEPGRHAAVRVSELLLDAGLPVRVATLPPEHDPDSLILAEGPEAFAKILDAAVSPIAFILAGRSDLSSDAGIIAASRDVVSLALHAQLDALAERMLREASSLLSISFPSLFDDFRKARAAASRPRPAAPATLDPVRVVPPASDIPDAERRLAILLSNFSSDRALTALVRENLPYTVLTHDGIRPIVSALAEEEGDVWSTLSNEPEAVRSLYASIAAQPNDVFSADIPEAHMRAATDILTAIWRDALIRIKSSTPIASPEYLPLVRDIRTLSTRCSWSVAQPIIARHLDSV